MTAIAAVAFRGHCWMAGDSACTVEDGARVITSDPKVWRVGPYVMGIAGDGAADRALASIEWKPGSKWFDSRALDAIMLALRQAGLEPDDTDALIGVRGQLYYYMGRSLFRSGDPFAAIGCAAEHLLGYLSASRRLNLTPAARVTGAVRSAIRYCDGVAGKVRLVSTLNPKKKPHGHIVK